VAIGRIRICVGGLLVDVGVFLSGGGLLLEQVALRHLGGLGDRVLVAPLALLRLLRVEVLGDRATALVAELSNATLEGRHFEADKLVVLS